MATELFTPLMTETEARLKTPLALAYIGDTVWDLLVRRSLLTGGWKAGMLHKQAVKLVNAAAGHEIVGDPTEADAAVVNTCAFIDAAQAEAMRVIRPHLTEAEEDIVRRGSNAHAKHAAPKNQDPADYSLATGLEALMGYLYLSGQMERIGEIFDIAQAIH